LHASAHHSAIDSLLDPAAAAFYSQGVSLWLTGIMVFSSVRGFLVQVMASDDL
jgi:hypothetical protein